MLSHHERALISNGQLATLALCARFFCGRGEISKSARPFIKGLLRENRRFEAVSLEDFETQTPPFGCAPHDVYSFPWRMSSVRAAAFFRSSRTRPRRKRIALWVFGAPNFPKAVGTSLFQKIDSHEEGCQRPDPACARGAPLCAQQSAQKAFAAPFSPPPEGGC